MLKNTKYKHLRMSNNNVVSLKGGASLGWTYNEDYLYIAVANCSIHDNFNRKIAREIIDERLSKIIETSELTQFSSLVSLEDVKKYLKSFANNMYKKDKYFEFIDSLTFKDITYEMFSDVALKIFKVN